MDREEELSTIKMINFANEFLKVAHGDQEGKRSRRSVAR
jgi:hypothetical protein